jgi:hypothetical protein
MIVIDPQLLTALAALVASVSTLIWSIRRKA